MLVKYEPLTYDTYVYPPWAQGVGLCMAFSSMACIPAYAVYALVTAKGSLKEVGRATPRS